ncbi:class I adenylate-forming enzyme family protein [Aeromicrobium sp. UC242_57]|uniref:class I adenylate-forming enzyme family protein n=1 Tax=Aeromicrobium sp. UC242_57 TaxID=3374624 RepID=UPI0037B960C4
MSTILTAEQSHDQQQRFAGSLAARGIVAGDRVVLSLAGSTQYVSAVLGATRSGVVPVPLDPRLTPHERDAIIGDVSPALVIDDDTQLSALLAGPEHALAPFPRCRPMHFTSGTTGRPKGVWSGLLDESDAQSLALEERRLWSFAPTDLNLIVSPIYHSAPLRFAMGTLLAGGSVTALPSFDPAALAAAIDSLRPTTMFCVPVHLQRLFAWLDETGTQLDSSSLRLLAHAGAACPEPVRRRTHDTFGIETVWSSTDLQKASSRPVRLPSGSSVPGRSAGARDGRVMTADDDGQLWCAVPPWARFTYWNAPEKTTAAWKRPPTAQPSPSGTSVISRTDTST